MIDTPILTIRISAQLLDALTQAAATVGTTRSELVRRFLEKGLKETCPEPLKITS